MNTHEEEPPAEHEPPKADGQTSASSYQDAAGDELLRVLSTYVAVLREGASEKQIALLMGKRSVSPQRVVCLLDYAAQLNTSLVRLRLSKNPLGPEGARLLGSALVTNNTLQFLELDACELVGSAYRPQLEGVLALSKGIQSVRSRLRYVNIASNDLQPEGCRILLGAMSFHKTLTALDMSDNLLSLFNDKQGFLALSYVLQYSQQLCWLRIAHNPLTPTAASELKASVAANHSLTSLDAAHCGITRDEWLDYRSTRTIRSASPVKTGRKSAQQRPDGLLHMLKC
ncbi:hypothetical protein PHYPSEUDO_004290 [Phytophthora pseudosyringae]|uniref:Uncharacterized protein n=1 Tax=Phytophthora pseudosyringae TaxID=221518 RepID=A0A8T1VRQ0_9STRA|nr:hypothetical protein PHYPSEUDO_004290 [Phytophthora pseudosyringae]